MLTLNNSTSIQLLQSETSSIYPYQDFDYFTKRPFYVRSVNLSDIFETSQ